MLRLTIFLLLLGLSACRAPSTNGETINLPLQEATPKRIARRIVSLDYCADQYVLKLVDRENILAVSPDAGKAFSYMRESAKNIPTLPPRAEDVLIHKPDLVVRSYGGGPNATAFFERAGIPVLNIGWASDFDGIKHVIQTVADQLGESEKGAVIVADMNARLQTIRDNIKPNTTRTALYITPSGVTTGPGSLVHEMLIEANLENFETQAGWRSLPLERLVYEQPDLVAAAFFGTQTKFKDSWSPMHHPVTRKKMQDIPTINIQGAWTSCGAWYLLDAVEALANDRTLEEHNEN
ncbi:MAG: iron ABC transporter substrate-binding protein [Robiginitomaculum sp.]|nr:MAG: iron ABC transporter substrate-binding protein [Robiginitomaculum sp.]